MEYDDDEEEQEYDEEEYEDAEEEGFGEEGDEDNSSYAVEAVLDRKTAKVRRDRKCRSLAAFLFFHIRPYLSTPLRKLTTALAHTVLFLSSLC